MEVCDNTDICFFGNAPSLTDIRLAFGSNAPVIWLLPQLFDLSEFCGCRDKLEGKPLAQCAYVIATEFKHLKTTELMLFFHRFKSGRYGRFYGSVDPLIITTALQQFTSERADEIQRHEALIAQRKRESYSLQTCSYEEYCELKNKENNNE